MRRKLIRKEGRPPASPVTALSAPLERSITRLDSVWSMLCPALEMNPSSVGFNAVAKRSMARCTSSNAGAIYPS